MLSCSSSFGFLHYYHVAAMQLQWVYIFLHCSTYYSVSGACHWIHSLQRGIHILIITASDRAFSSCSLQVEYSSWYCILTWLLRPTWSQPHAPRCAALLGSDSVKVLLSVAFNPAELPGCCSQYGYGWVTKTPFCSVTLLMKIFKYHFSFRPQTCRLKNPTDSAFPAFWEM